MNLNSIFARTDRIRLFAGGARDGKAMPDAYFICEAAGDEIGKIRQSLRLDPLKASPRCLCHGTIAIECWSQGELLTTVALHHHLTLRVPGPWPLDGVLADGLGLARWLAERGYPEELEYEASKKRRDLEFDEAPPNRRDLESSRLRGRQSPSQPRSLGPPTTIATDGPYRNLLSSNDRVLAMRGTHIVSLQNGRSVMNTRCPRATFAKGYWFYVALPSRQQVVHCLEERLSPRVEADAQTEPRIIPSVKEFEALWICSDRSIVSKRAVLFESYQTIRCAYRTEHWVYWSNDQKILRLRPDSVNPEAEVVADRPAAAFAQRGDEIIIAFADGVVWEGNLKLGQTRFQPADLAADQDGIYVLTQQSESAWAVESIPGGILAEDLDRAETASMALTSSHLYLAAGPKILQLERLP